ncbi:MAG: BPSS1780 family membrane protein [Methylotenera sp.]|nr:BPSS1780 family membrane protein [Methylotenera sp.]
MEQQPQIQTIKVRQVPALNGYQWIMQGIDLFRLNPVMWVILLVLYLLIMIPVSLIPVLGSIASTLLAPVFAAGMMWGCRALSRNQDLEINHLFQGFKQNTSQLISVGGVYMLSLLIIAVLVVLMLDKEAVGLLAQGKDLSPEQASAVLLPLLTALLLIAPVLMAYWFAPVLAGLHRLNAVDAMRLSFIACLKNMLPFLLYGMVLTLILAVVLWLLINVSTFLSVIFLALIPVMMTSLYASYADIFEVEEAGKAL